MQFDLNYFLAFVFTPPSSLLIGLVITVVVTIASMVLGIVLGLLLAIGGLSRYHTLRGLNQCYLVFFRGTPTLVQLMLVYFGLPALFGGADLFPPHIPILGFSLNGALLAGSIAFGLHEAAYMSEITRSGILAIDRGQAEAAKALGMTPALSMRRIILPQAVRIMVPPLGNQFNAMLKTTSLLSVIAVPEMFHVAESVQAATFKTFEVYLGVSLYYLALTSLWGVLQRAIERRVRLGGTKQDKIDRISTETTVVET
ncbi:amino acid ABC transporter permease [Microvirga sp. 2MCAF38]|uniref:amino acid ABC transporter permease n=1 Tax=Microvirga sp. 2MCAF38 TaxID=3232989 RepID=UPI003F9499FC